MKMLPDSVFRLAVVLLVVISTVGAISATQRYFTLVALSESLQSKRSLEDSFVLMVKSGLATTKVDGVLLRSVEDESEQLRVVHDSIAKLASQTLRWELVDASLWTLMFAISSTLLIVGRRRSRT
ncbi:hypothetical protein [uncultured Methylibium sp.]|uniref:hypothetical protein n=1 Tax=uncultured Methylibium sp. TaxID=381093 RepID=UPI0025F60871|nr:hypothetical protein [uncultured Methylibium sp.]